jgi:hypothetical protein
MALSTLEQVGPCQADRSAFKRFIGVELASSRIQDPAHQISQKFK